MTNPQSARARIGPQMIAIFGSVLRDGARARDVDVCYSGVEPHVAAQAAEAWVRKHRPDMIGWQGDITLDLHEARWVSPYGDQPGHFTPLQAVEETDPVLALLGPAPSVQVDTASLPRAIRYFARHGRLPDAWRLRVGIDPKRADEDDYFGGGLRALRKAAEKVPSVLIADLTAALGPVFSLLLRRDPTPAEVASFACGFPGGGGPGIDWYPVNGTELWRASTTHGPRLMVRPREDGVPMLFDGVLVPVP